MTTTVVVLLGQDTAHAETATATAIVARDESTMTTAARLEAATDPLHDDRWRIILHRPEGEHMMTLTAGTTPRLPPIPMALVDPTTDLPEIFLHRERGTLVRATHLVTMNVEVDTGNCFHSS